MPREEPEFLKNLNKYGPKKSENISVLEETTATAAGRKPRTSEEMLGQNLLAIAGDPKARKKNEQLMQEVKELGDQYKREARDVDAPSQSVISRLKNSLGFKHGGKVSTTKPNKKQPRW